MEKDIKSIGYAVKTGDTFVTEYQVIDPFENAIRVEAGTARVMLFSFNQYGKDMASKAAKNIGGKVVEIYAREVSEDEAE